MKTPSRFAFVLLFAVVTSPAVAVSQTSGFYWNLDTAWEAPSDYYSTAAGLTGSTLRDQVHLIIEKDYYSNALDFSSTSNINAHTQHRVNTYDDAGPALDALDQAGPRSGIFDPVIINHVYDNENRDLTDPEGRNREHIWSSARQQPGTTRGADTESDFADLYNLRWADADTNFQKLARNFDDGAVVSPAQSAQDGAGVLSNGEWYPGDGHRGDIARTQFYMDVRYDGNTAQDPNTTDLALVNGQPSFSGITEGDLDSMLDWHYADPVNAWEVRRNYILFNRSYQNEFGGTETPNNWITPGNRNFAVDRPEYVHAIFEDNANDSTISIDDPDAVVNADGSSSLDVQLGRVMQGQPAGSLGTVNVTVDKAGADGTYYQVTTGGGATSSVDGRYNAFLRGQSDSFTLQVGLSGSVNTANSGLQGGTLTVDNLDVTTAGGTGNGANDGDDTINVGVAVLADRVISATNADLGTFIVEGAGSGATTLDTTGDDNERTRIMLNAGAYASGGVTVTATSNLFDADGEFDVAAVAGSFATPGAKAGAVTLSEPNGALTGEGLTGESVNDINVNYTATVLEHADASFNAAADQNTLNLDFGLVRQGQALAPLSFDIFNLEAAPGFTADLDLDSVLATGDTGTLTTTVAAPAAIAAGASQPFHASLDTAVNGLFTAAYTIENSDQDLDGAIDGTDLLLNLDAEVALLGDVDTDGDQAVNDIDAADIDALFADFGFSNVFADLDDSGLVDQLDADQLVQNILGTEYGDANLDGNVNISDLTTLAGNFGGGTGWTSGDVNGDGVVNITDLTTLSGNFGFTAPVPVTAIPEPTTVALLGLGGLALLRRRWNRQ